MRVESSCNLEKVFDPSTFPVSLRCNDAEDFVALRRASRHTLYESENNESEEKPDSVDGEKLIRNAISSTIVYY